MDSVVTSEVSQSESASTEEPSASPLTVSHGDPMVLPSPKELAPAELPKIGDDKAPQEETEPTEQLETDDDKPSQEEAEPTEQLEINDDKPPQEDNEAREQLEMDNYKPSQEETERIQLPEIEDEIVTRKPRTRHIIQDSDDSESEYNISVTKRQPLSDVPRSDEKPPDVRRRRKRITRVNSDSDSDKEPGDLPDHLQSVSDVTSEAAPVYTTNSSGELVPESTDQDIQARLTTLCDPDSEDDDNQSIRGTERSWSEEETAPTRSKSNIAKGHNQKSNEDKPKKMTAKEAAEQRNEIHSDFQRLLRERNISLPYHKPKSHSIQEFLAKRPKLSNASLVTGSVRTPVAIKMSTEQLKIVSKQLQEREKEVKEFYKSESESEPEDNEQSSEKQPVESEPMALDLDTEPENATQSKQVVAEANADPHNIAGAEEFTESSTLTADDTVASAGEELPENTPLTVQEETPENSSPTRATTTITTSEDHDSLSMETSGFNLVIDEQTPERSPPTATTSFTFGDIDREIENFDITNGKDTDDAERQAEPLPSRLELLKDKLANEKPRLSGGPNDVIDLESGVARPHEVVQLMERFAKHATVKKHHPRHKEKFNVIRVDSDGDIHKEEVSVDVPSDDEAVPDEKPGVRFKRLKEELQKQMEQKKAEIWQQKAAKGIKGRLEDESEGTGEKDILDDDEEEVEMTDEESEEEDELIEDDVELKDKPTKKSKFLDEEAEVSDVEEEEDNFTLKLDYEECAPADSGDEEAEEEGSNSDRPDATRTLKRVIKPADDSDDECSTVDGARTLELDSTITADEDDIPSHQPRQSKTPVKSLSSQTASISDFLTPISFITSIQNLVSAPKNVNKDHLHDKVSPFKPPPDPQPASETISPKRLFSCPDNSTTQDSESAIAHDDAKGLTPADFEPGTQDLLGICSGNFTGITPSEGGGNEPSMTQRPSGDEIKSFDREDAIISQLLDEEELENFKKKFESPVNRAATQAGAAEEILGGGVIDSADEEDGPQELRKRRKKKLHKRIQFSDDESSESEEHEEEIDLQDKEGLEDEGDTEEHLDMDRVDYDSEENEIDANNEEEEETRGLKLTDFLEKEAELSGSEWGSEDEDEKGLDKFEFELGDTETIDEEKVKSDLEKIHMRRLLDDDTREVKLLQELLLEDGEMHGTGRQRQFKWRNIDDDEGADRNDENRPEDDVYLDEEESEEQWRKRRHEREVFLTSQKKQKGLADLDDNDSASGLLRLGQKFLQKSVSSNVTPNGANEKSNGGSPIKSSPFSLQNKRGSFLNRTDHVLQRVAEFTKETTTIDGNSRKTTKHFLFQSVAVMEGSAAIARNKRKATEGTPNMLKKIRLNPNLSPAVKPKRDKPDSSKKLFDF